MFKRKSTLEKMELRGWRRFNRRSKKIKYQHSDNWSWTFPIPEGGIPKIIENKFGNGK